MEYYDYKKSLAEHLNLGKPMKPGYYYNLGRNEFSVVYPDRSIEYFIQEESFFYDQTFIGTWIHCNQKQHIKNWHNEARESRSYWNGGPDGNWAVIFLGNL